MGHYPELRNIEAFPIEENQGEKICIRDPEGVSEELFVIDKKYIPLLQLMDGKHSLSDLQTNFFKQTGEQLAMEKITALLQDLDKNLFLKSENFSNYYNDQVSIFAKQPLREAIHAGTAYENSSPLLHSQITGFYTHKDGPGLPKSNHQKTNVSALIAPHIDISAGGSCFAWAYKELAESIPPELVIILGTGHMSNSLFTCTDKDFVTPLGTMQSDKEFIQSLAGQYSGNLREDEFIHKQEHSIEFQCIWLQHLFGSSTIKIVPVLCGSFHEYLYMNNSPMDSPEVSSFVHSMRTAIKESGKRVCVIASVDLAHVGLRYGDPSKPDEQRLQEIEKDDLNMLHHVESGDAEQFFKSIQMDNDSRKICGFAAIYTLLNLLDKPKGKLLKYSNIFMDDNNDSLVSFASLVFD